MNQIAIILILVSSFMHVYWNFLLKKSKNQHAFNLLFLYTSLIIYFPIFIYFASKTTLTKTSLLFILLSGLSNGLYFYFLSKSYSAGELSIVYPISRSGIIFIPFLAFFFLGERLSFQGMFAIVLVLVGIFILHLEGFSWQIFKRNLKASTYAIITALFVAIYSLVDKVGASTTHPFVYLYLSYLLTVFFLVFLILVDNKNYTLKKLKLEIKYNNKNLVISAIFVFLGYLLILFAYLLDNVSYVVGLRQISILLSLFVGFLFLKEKLTFTKALGTLVMFIGFVLISIS